MAPEETDAYLVRLFRQMETAFPDALVTDRTGGIDHSLRWRNATEGLLCQSP
jgi:hypothetical protein